MSEDKLAKHHMQRCDKLVADRAPFDRDWRDIQDLVRPVTVAFDPASGAYTHVRTEAMFDGTAPDALMELASALHSFVTNPAERWFEVQLEGVSDDELSDEEADWLEEVSNVIYAQYRRSGSNLNGALHEGYLDVGSFGNSIICQEWDSTDAGIVFSCKPLAQCFFLENNQGRVDTLYRRMTWTIRQVKQEFGELLPPKLMEIVAKGDDKPVDIIQCVYPRTDTRPGITPGRMKFGSLWICVNTKEILRESGYESFPYHVARWLKLSGEAYGRGPAKQCLADIKMLNVMERTILKAGQKEVDPPLILANEAFLLPIKTSPGSLIFKENEESTITPLLPPGSRNLPWGEDKAEQKRGFIRKCFHSDWIRREKKPSIEQTAAEIYDDRDEMLRLFAPILGRLVTEQHGPMITRSYGLLNSRGRIPPAPASMTGRNLTVGYLSPASRAQTGTRANQISRFVQDLIPMAQVEPGIMDHIDFDQVAVELAKARGTPRAILRSPAEVEERRGARKMQEAAMAAAQVAEPASKAALNLAKAQEAGA